MESLLMSYVLSEQIRASLILLKDEMIILGFAVVCALLSYKLLFWCITKIIAEKEKLAEPVGKYLRKPMMGILIIIAIRLAVPYLGFSAHTDEGVRVAVSISLICLICWALIQSTRVMDDFVTAHFDINAQDNWSAKKAHTQMRIMKQVIVIMSTIIGLGSTLMMFEKVRQLGTSLLASAGIIGLVVGVAAQKTLANFIAGLQIALTQPIRLEDVVIIENEWGKIEEITLTYVVIRLWDMRRLIVPVNYFFEKPFQNWTRTTSEIIGTVYIYVDYSVSVEAVRQEFYRIVESSILWNRKVKVLQLTNANEHNIELRALMSVDNASKAWDLRCEVREKLIVFLQKEYPEALPRVRIELPKNLSNIP